MRSADEILHEILTLRASGNVSRWHIIPTCRRQNVSEHVAQMLTLLFCLHDSPTIDLVRAILFHDSAELCTGDVPAPLKWKSSRFEELMEEFTLEFLCRFPSTRDLHARLSDDDLSWLQGLDALEGYLYCRDQLTSGNDHYSAAVQRSVDHLMNGNFPGIVKLVVETDLKLPKEERIRV